MKIQPTTKELIQMLYERLPELFDRVVPVQEPVAYMDKYGEIYKDVENVLSTDIPLYTTPPAAQRKPLTNEQIFAIGKALGARCRLGGNPNIDLDYARAIEQAHGIKERSQ